MKKILSVVCFFCLCRFAEAQYYSTGQDCASVSWQQIETDEFQLVYPDYLVSQGQYLANLLKELYRKSSQDFGVEPQKISILLHAETSTSNGYVAWAPKRSEMFTTAPNIGLPQDWLTHLATHEYRHVVQMNSFETSLSKLLRIIFGEQIVPAFLSYKVPKWFLEGDAVFSETQFSNSGRGRSPEFLQVMKAHLLQNPIFDDYDKATFGSYKDFTPSVYHLGYAMVANTRKKYGSEVWKKTLEMSAKKPFPWQDFLHHSLSEEKIVSENKTKQVYRKNLLELQKRWREEQQKIKATPYEIVSPKKKVYTDYRSPQVLPDGSILALKSGFDDYEKIVKLKNGEEQKCYTIGMATSNLSLSQNLLFWTEVQPNIRWENRSKNVIYELDLQSGKKRKIEVEESLNMPSASADNSRIVAVVKYANYTNEIVILGFATNRVIERYPFGQQHVSQPKFINKNTIVYIFTDNRGTGIATLDLLSKKTQVIVEKHNVPLRDLTVANNTLYFTAGYDGKNDIYRYDFVGKSLQKITESSFGAQQASILGDTLVYMNYTDDGYELAKIPLSKTLQKTVRPSDWKDDILITANKGESSHELDVSDSVFPTKHYKKGAHLFNFHSRSPLAISADGSYDIGISTSSQNLLSTMFFNLGYRRQSNYRNGQAYANLTYKGWFPIVSTTLTYGKKSEQMYALLGNHNLLDTALLRQDKNRWKWNTKMVLPFNISRGKYIRNFYVSAEYEHTKDSKLNHTYLRGTQSSLQKGDAVNLAIDQANNLLTYRFAFSNLHKKSYRDIYSPFAQQLFVAYQHTPFVSQNAYTYSVEGIVYLPSLCNHHGLKIYGGYQYLSDYHDFFDNIILGSRGTSSTLGEKMYTLRTTYKFPLAYPDWHLGTALYIKRLKAGFFYDYSSVKWSDSSENAHSYGVELTADTHFIQIPIPVDWGVRVGYETQTSKAFCNLMFSLSF